MQHTCLNCHAHFKGNYCPECGQKATVKRITGGAVIAEVIHFFTHLEKGFLHTSLSLLAKPGLVSLDYLEGKRKNYQPPVSYLLIWTSVYILAHNFIIRAFSYTLSNEALTLPGITEEANEMLRKHFTLFIAPLPVVSALLIFLILARKRFYFSEVLTLCIYGTGTYFMMLFASDVIFGSILHVNVLSANIFTWQSLLSSVYNFWFSYDLFKRIQLKNFWLRLITVTVLITLIGWSILVYLPQAWIAVSGRMN